MGKLLDTRRMSGVGIATALSFLLVVLITYGATSASTSLSTGGSLTVTGASTLTGAVTMSSSLSVDGGALTFNDSSANDLDVRMEGAAEANLFFLDGSTDRIGIATNAPNTTFEVVGTASTTKLVVGGEGSISGLIKGTCTVFSGITVVRTSPTTGANCFIASGTPGLSSTHKIFISATGTVADNLVITGASSTASNIIGISATTTSAASGSPNITVAAFSLEFFGIR